MRIEFKSSFTEKLERQVFYISYDSPSRARKFKGDLIKEIKRIPKNPFLFRKSIFFDDNNIRDLIFKGYVIVFKVNTIKNTIEIFGFTKYQDKPF